RREPTEPKTAAPTPAADAPSESGAPIISTGSGIAVSAAQGGILTNHHVIDGCHDILVRRAPGQVGHASLLFDDTQNDLALLKSDIVFSDAEAAPVRVAR